MCLGQNDFVDLKFALRNQSKADTIKLIEYAMSIKPKSHNLKSTKIIMMDMLIGT
jgi:molybdenum cofactor biosynthesis enzyme MoaA